MTPIQEFTKRAFDVAIALVALLVLVPLVAVVAVAVKCSSRGPVLFRQRRIGRGGVPFWLYKFRTMHPATGGPSITAASDKRITPIGRWLRRWKLDELPQILNVLRGEMSWVGPRPEVPQYVSLYDDTQQGVLLVRPGITGPSQIRFRDEEHLLAAQADPERYYVMTLLPSKLALDLEYARQPRLRRDLYFLLCTVLAICWPKAAPEGTLPTASRPRPRGRERTSARRRIAR